MLYRLHAADMLRLATRLLGNEPDADDAVHDAFVRAFDNIDQCKGSRLGGWLRQITINECRGHMRRERRRAWWKRRPDVRASLFAVGHEPAGPSVGAELDQVARFLAHLPTKERMAWSLQRLEGMSLAEVADAVGASLATVKRRVANAETRIARWSSR